MYVIPAVLRPESSVSFSFWTADDRLPIGAEGRLRRLLKNYLNMECVILSPDTHRDKLREGSFVI